MRPSPATHAGEARKKAGEIVCKAPPCRRLPLSETFWTLLNTYRCRSTFCSPLQNIRLAGLGSAERRIRSAERRAKRPGIVQVRLRRQLSGVRIWGLHFLT